MRILFLTILNITDIEKHGLYEDLLYEFVKGGHDVTVVSPREKREGGKTELLQKDNYKILKVYTENIQKTSFIKKGIATVLLPFRFKKAIKKYIDYKHYDLIMCSTPPITLAPLMAFLKRKSAAKMFLLLKDIWPQTMVDMGALKEKGIICRYFREKEKKMYKTADYIGCTSKANIDYVKNHNDVDEGKLLIVTNGLSKDVLPQNEKIDLHDKLGINKDKKIFFYGGNLGVPQGIDFLIECMKKTSDNENIHYLICGQGTQRCLLEEYVSSNQAKNVTLLDYLPQDEYTKTVASVDVCMVFLNHKFTVPNCPARFYAYMQGGKPILAVTDEATDIKEDIEKGGFGWWCASNDSDKFAQLVNEANSSDLERMSVNSREWFDKYYTTEIAYKTIIETVSEG